MAELDSFSNWFGIFNGISIPGWNLPFSTFINSVLKKRPRLMSLIAGGDVREHFMNRARTKVFYIFWCRIQKSFMVLTRFQEYKLSTWNSFVFIVSDILSQFCKCLFLRSCRYIKRVHMLVFLELQSGKVIHINFAVWGMFAFVKTFIKHLNILVYYFALILNLLEWFFYENMN